MRRVLTCRLLTHDTWLARSELLGEVDIVEGARHTRSDNVIAALAAGTVTVVVLQLIRGNAIARAIRNRSCKMTVTKLAVQRCGATAELQLPSI